MRKKPEGYFKDDGTPVDPVLISKPGLCVTCKHDNDPARKIVCDLARMDQHRSPDFRCEAYNKII